MLSAEAKTRALLLAHLSPVQRRQARRGVFTVIGGQSGWSYRVKGGWLYIRRRNERHIFDSPCYRLVGDNLYYDHQRLAAALAIKHDELNFLRDIGAIDTRNALVDIVIARRARARRRSRNVRH